MNPYRPITTGFALGLTWGLTYLLCALVTSLFPTLLADALAVLVHGLDVAPFRQPVPAMSVVHVVVGAAFFTMVGVWVGALYAVLANALGARRARS